MEEVKSTGRSSCSRAVVPGGAELLRVSVSDDVAHRHCAGVLAVSRVLPSRTWSSSRAWDLLGSKGPPQRSSLSKSGPLCLII